MDAPGTWFVRAPFVSSALLSYIVRLTLGNEPIGAIQIITGWLVPLICMVLVVAGFKGWLWLRANGVRRTLHANLA